MLGLRQVQGRAFPVGGGGGEIRQPGLEHISDAQGPHSLPQVHLGGHVEFGHRQVDEQVLLLGPGAVDLPGEQQLLDLGVAEKFLRGDPLVGEEEPHGSPALPQAPGHRPEAVAPVVGAGPLPLVQKVHGHVPGGAVEGLGAGVAGLELIGPLALEVQGAGQGQHRVPGQVDVPGLLLQQAAGLVVEPVLQRLVHFRRAHLPLEGGCVVILRQQVHGLLHVLGALPQPQGAGGDHRAGAVVHIEGIPHPVGQVPAVLDGLAAQQVQHLFPAVPVGELRQHGQGQVDVHRRADHVLPLTVREEGGQALPPKAVQAGGEALFLAVGLFGLPPSVPLAFEVGGVLIGVGGHLRVLCLADGRRLQGRRPEPGSQQHPQPHHHNQGRSGGHRPPGAEHRPALGVLQVLLVHVLHALKQFLGFHRYPSFSNSARSFPRTRRRITEAWFAVIP